MPAFAITAAGGFPPPTAEEFPNFIQWQNQGTDLGLPDVDTINVSTNLTATRGTGENANTVTITASGGGGGAPQVLLLRMLADGLTAMDGSSPTGWTVTYNLVESTDATWDAGTSTLTLVTPGTYEIKITCTLVYDTDSIFNTDWVQYGTGTDLEASNRHYLTRASSGTPPLFNTAKWTDIYWYQTDSIGGAQSSIYAFAQTYNGAAQQAQYDLTLSVTKISDEVSA